MMDRSRTATLATVLAAATLLAAGAAAGEAPRYSRWSGGGIALTVDDDLLAAGAWDLGRPFANPAVAEDLRADPGPAGRLRSQERLGAGRLTVPAGEFAAVLRREEVFLEGGRTAWQYRWVAEGGLTLAIVRGPVGAGRTFDEPALLVRLEAGGLEAGLRVYSDEIGGDLFTHPCDLGTCVSGDFLHLTFDASPDPDPEVTVPLSGITTQGYTTGAEFVNASVWDFTPVVGMARTTVAETNVPINLDETCEAERCGYSLSTNDFLTRQDNVDTGIYTNAVFDKDSVCVGGDTPSQICDPLLPDPCPGNPAGICVPVVLLRAAAQFEGTSGETRFCHDGQNDAGGNNRGQVTQWLFPNPDAGRFYMQVGDTWQSTLFNCTLNFFRQNCGAPGLFDELTSDGCNDHLGGFNTDVLGEGSVKLPSGHWVDVLVLQQLADFCLWLPSSNCVEGIFSFPVQEVRQPVVLFVAPGQGTVAQINGPVGAADASSWTGVNETAIRYGLLPPLDIQVDAVDDTTTTLSWTVGTQFGCANPVNNCVDRVKIHWDTDSGSTSAYAFNSDDDAGQVAFGPDGADAIPLDATVTGLTPGTTYHFTVTLLDSFTEPDATPFTVEYESNLFPAVIHGTIGGPGGTPVAYPEEVTAMTTSPGCTPTIEVTNLNVSHAAGSDLTFSWAPVSDPCLDHYVLLGADDSSDTVNFVPVANTGTATSFTGDPAPTFYLVVTEGAGGQRGPLGH